MDTTDLDTLPVTTDTPEALAGFYHYAEDGFVKAAVNLKRQISRALAKLPPAHREIAQQYAKGKGGRQIAKDLGKDERNLWRVIKKPEVQHVIGLIQHYELVIDGPLEMQRKHMLWRIATDNEKKAPKTAVEAIDKLNKMAKSYATESGASGNIQIVINNAALPRGVLDQ